MVRHQAHHATGANALVPIIMQPDIAAVTNIYTAFLNSILFTSFSNLASGYWNSLQRVDLDILYAD
jgi:hypothetical protein